jgi:hypothetical protein
MLSPLLVESSQAALCAFRNPDKDVYALFPEATGYRSVIVKLDKKAQEKTEKYLGQKLDFDEVGEHTFYLILKDKDVIGMIRPHAERGRYGIVEMVWAFTINAKIKDYKIQRSRERGTDKVKSEEFRGQFRGKTLKVTFTEANSKKINSELFKVPERSERVCSVIAFSAKKNLFLYKHFFPEYNRNTEKDTNEKPAPDPGQKDKSK